MTRTRPSPQVDRRPGGRTVWLRLTKAGTTYTGEYSFDGTTWTAFAGTRDERDGRRRSSGCTPSACNSSGDTVTFEYFKVDGVDRLPADGAGATARR